ncbi:MAG: Uma2 family endonuclease [Acidobacteria bacterium]|nr:Uma2 family endonuclease [Acidobacteriota bacterium]
MASVQQALMTVEEFSRLPEEGPYAHELHGGVLVRVTRPKFKHTRIQRQLRKLLSAAARDELVEIEMPFRPLEEHEVRAADVAVVRAAREAQIDPDDYLHGSPELVVEVLSPSNTATEMYEKEQLCLSTGCEEFWVVDPKRRQVRVSRSGSFAYYGPGQSIPLTVLGGGEIAVDSIFS